MALASFINSLTLIDDPRHDKNKRYPLSLLLLIAFCASISRHDFWHAMQDYAEVHEASIRELYKHLFGVELEYVTPRHDTLNRTLQAIPHNLFKHARQDSIASLFGWDSDTKQICIDGKTCVGSSA